MSTSTNSKLKYLQYFLIAAITAALAQVEQPTTQWEWWKMLGAAVLQGIVAMKALQSDPNVDGEPTKVEVTNPPENPVETHEQK